MFVKMSLYLCHLPDTQMSPVVCRIVSLPLLNGTCEYDQLSPFLPPLSWSTSSESLTTQSYIMDSCHLMYLNPQNVAHNTLLRHISDFLPRVRNISSSLQSLILYPLVCKPKRVSSLVGYLHCHSTMVQQRKCPSFIFPNVF